MNSPDKEEKEKEQLFIPYSINIMPVEHVSNIPERIDVMGLLYNNTSQAKGGNTVIQQYLPKTLKKEITEDQIDGLYDNLKLLSSEKRKNMNAASLINYSIMPFDKYSSNNPSPQAQDSKAQKNKEDPNE